MKNRNDIQVDLTNKVALITGSSRDLGAYYAKVLSQNGAHVIVSGRDGSQDRLDKIVSDIRSDGYQASSTVLDLADTKSFQSKIADIISAYGRIDILINNAGISQDQDFFSVDELVWDKHFDINIKGLFFLTQIVSSYMINQPGHKHIINIAAINGQRIRKNCLPFSVSKAAVIHLTKAVAYELIEYDIHVNAISLGLFPSEAVVDYLKNDNTAQDYLDRIPIKRAGYLSELAGPILLLSSDASNYINGSVVNIDGGFSINAFM